MNSVTFSD